MSMKQSNNFLHMKDGNPNRIQCPAENVTVDIIIPIYNSLDYTKTCIESVYQNTDLSFNLFLINDCSTDPKVNDYLKRLSGLPKPSLLRELLIIHNDRNMGYASSINKGLSFIQNHAVLLNTDTEVPKNWLSRIMAPIIADSNIASVTPFSNSATICSFPEMAKDNPLPNHFTVQDLDHLFNEYGSSHPIPIPTGVGFCMAVSRHAINKIGTFDAVTFGKGYGEENDWCLRARNAGFKNVLCPNLFVYHKHGASFGPLFSKKHRERKMANVMKLIQKYPNYLPTVQDFIKKDPIKPIRDIVMSAMMARIRSREKEKKG